MRRFLPLLALAACTSAAPLVTTTNTPPPPRYAVADDSPASPEVRRQLEAKGLYAADSPTLIRTGFAATPRSTGSCAATDPAAKTTCAQWIDTPQTGWSPFAPPLRYRLTLVIDDAAIIVTQPGSKNANPLAALVTAALAKLPAVPR